MEALNQAAADKAIHDELAAAFGKNGVQALIIDGVLPEIADEANRLLIADDRRPHVAWP